MPRLIRPNPGDPITADWAFALVDAINDLQRGPKVCSPLAKLDGAIYIGQDFELKTAKTTMTIPKRVGGQWGKGTAQFIVLSIAGLEATSTGSGGLPATVWNYFGADISGGIRVQVAWMHGRYVIVGGDCSGVP